MNWKKKVLDLVEDKRGYHTTKINNFIFTENKDLSINYTSTAMGYKDFYIRKTFFDKSLKKLNWKIENYYQALYYVLEMVVYCFNTSIILDKKIIDGNKLELE